MLANAGGKPVRGVVFSKVVALLRVDKRFIEALENVLSISLRRKRVTWRAIRIMRSSPPVALSTQSKKSDSMSPDIPTS